VGKARVRREGSFDHFTGKLGVLRDSMRAGVSGIPIVKFAPADYLDAK
jgi:hypothetical protein